MNIFVARQPIFNPNNEVVAYELLYRDSMENRYAGHLSDNVATSLLLVNSFINFGIENLVGEHRAFINFDGSMLASGAAEILDKDKVVIEILETVKPDYRVIKKIQKLKDSGYTIALDDITAEYDVKEMFRLAEIMKIDFMDTKEADIKRLVKRFKSEGKEILAEKVETVEEFEWAKGLGFDYFQGYYFAKPSIKNTKQLSNNAIQYIKLMSELNEAVPNYERLANIIKLDIALTVKMLKLVNGHKKQIKPIDSIKHALVFLGVDAIKRWLSLAVVQNLSSPETYEITRYAFTRAAFLERLALNTKFENKCDELALLGTISILDKIFDRPMEDLVNELPLSDALKNVLIDKDSEYTSIFKLCMAYEKGEFEEAEKLSNALGHDFNTLQNHYIESVKWAEKTFDELNKFKK